MRRILRYEVPVDDQWHAIAMSGGVDHVGCRQPDVVEFWSLDSGGPTVDMSFRVYGTGHSLPDEVTIIHRGTTYAAGGSLVWHLMEAR